MNYYQLLNCPNTAGSEQIQAEYRTIALHTHPDKNIDKTDVKFTDFALITQARDILLDPSLRHLYDKWLYSQIPISFQDFMKKQQGISCSTHFTFESVNSKMIQTEQQTKPWRRDFWLYSLRDGF
ncbi:J domain-containing protein isoform X2 [Oopsacas minuta]|uniref:J domain-containing protein isoform X2 n=1 Tax=Oopsacas minuta TaxID=111878 RepID=A0AAV7JXW1_9METZ|nr:J domain-containing protein isoform X2 [Oopsacas minuta]